MERATRVPSSNMGREKQGEALRADVMKPRVSGRWPDVHDLQTPRRMSAHMLCVGPLGRQEQILWRGGIEDAPKPTTLSESEQYLA